MERLIISKAQLRRDYEEMRVVDILEKYGICFARLYSLLDQCGIERKVNKAARRPAKKVILKD